MLEIRHKRRVGYSAPGMNWLLNLRIQNLRLSEDNLVRRPLWIPVVLGVGIGFYFFLGFEPSLEWLLGLALLLWLFVTFMKRTGNATATAISIAFALIATGAFSGAFENWRVSAPIIEEQYGAQDIDGTISLIEDRGSSLRLLLEDVWVASLTKEQQPRKIRISYRGDTVPLIGDRIAVKAVLRPPPEPSVPGLYDFSRRAWFQGLGATGFAVSELKLIPGKKEGLFASAAKLVEIVRHELGQNIRQSMDSPTIGAIATALVTGDRSGITEEARVVMRDAGLSHLLAISGLHMGLVVVILFSGSRMLMAFFPALALNYPIKKIAAVFALFGSLVYLILAGAPVPTQRAFLMTSLVLLAVLIDRNALSMRMVAFAATVVLLVSPHVLTGASFQLSFAAVTALIALYETDSMRQLSMHMKRGFLRRLGGYFLLLMITTLVASLATAPLALHHFGVFAAYGILGNIVGVPLMAFVVMPGAVLALILMPLGLDFLGFALMEQGITMIYLVAQWVGQLDGAVYQLSPLDGISMLFIAVGALWGFLWVGKIRYWGTIGIIVGIVLAGSVKSPDLLISGNGKLMAFQTPQHGLLFNQTRAEKFAIRQWQQLLGLQDIQTFMAGQGVSGFHCDSVGCVWKHGKDHIAFVIQPEALAEDCYKSRILIAPNYWTDRIRCDGPEAVLNRGYLSDNGGVALYLDGRYPWQKGFLIENVRDDQGQRPWTRWWDKPDAIKD